MNLEKPKNKKQSFWYSPIVLFLMFFIVLVFIYNMIDIIDKFRETSKKKEIIETQLKELKEKQYMLSNKIDKLNTTEGIEEEIREKYQFVKEGEKMVVIVDKQKPKIEENTKVLEEEHNFIGFLKNLFK